MLWLRLATTMVAVIFLVCVSFAPIVLGQQTERAGSFQQAYVLWQEGYFLHSLGDYKGAADRFRRSIEVHPTAEGHTFLGWSLSYLGQTEKAIAECKKAIDLDPDYGNPYNDIGVYLIDLGRSDEAIPWLEKATRAKRYCCFQYPHFNLGRILLAKERVEEAVQAFERALSYDPNYLPARKALEVIREHEGEAL